MAPTFRPGINFNVPDVTESCYYITSLSIPYLDPNVQYEITNSCIYANSNLPRYTLPKAMLNHQATYGEFYKQTYVLDDRLIKTDTTSPSYAYPASVVDYYKAKGFGLYADITGIYVCNKVGSTYSADVKTMQLCARCEHNNVYLPVGVPTSYNAPELQLIRTPVKDFYVEIVERGDENSNRYGLRYYPDIKVSLDYYQWNGTQRKWTPDHQDTWVGQSKGNLFFFSDSQTYASLGSKPLVGVEHGSCDGHTSRVAAGSTMSTTKIPYKVTIELEEKTWKPLVINRLTDAGSWMRHIYVTNPNNAPVKVYCCTNRFHCNESGDTTPAPDFFKNNINDYAAEIAANETNKFVGLADDVGGWDDNALGVFFIVTHGDKSSMYYTVCNAYNSGTGPWEPPNQIRAGRYDLK